jgi:hypothetical protein
LSAEAYGDAIKTGLAETKITRFKTKTKTRPVEIKIETKTMVVETAKAMQSPLTVSQQNENLNIPRMFNPN